MIKKIIRKYYNQKVEDVGIRLLYFLNTIDTYFIIAGILSLALYSKGRVSLFAIAALTFMTWVVFKGADFYPVFLVFSPVYLFFLSKSSAFSISSVISIFLINLGIFAFIQFFFMSIPESVVARDPTIGFRKIYNSIFTIAPTLVSLPISLFYSTVFSLILVGRPNPFGDYGFLFWLTMGLAALMTNYTIPQSFQSREARPKIGAKMSERVVVLNIDGCRLDRFYEAQLPFLTSLQKESSYFPKGIQTIYRALTNPAFASMLTGAVPEVHGVQSNNLGQKIRVEALPDLVKTKLHGSMHVKHFSKPHWETKIVSLPTHSVYKSDEIMLEWLKEDLRKKDETRLFIADISELDFLGHAYGSETRHYLEAMKRVDKRIEGFFDFLHKNNLLDNTTIIICSDHGIIKIDHSYLLFDAERYVPCLITGNRIRSNNPLTFEASIMDIAPTISYLLGIEYPNRCKGRVFTEAIAPNNHTYAV